eukprot:3225016-Pyramimonas_sp.AAC.1
MSCITRGGLRGFWGTMFQNGRDCPNVFGCEPIKRILQGKDMEGSDTFNAFIEGDVRSSWPREACPE